MLLKSTQPVLTDTRGHRAERCVRKLVGLGIAAGNGDDTYAPDGSITGAQATKLLSLSLGLTADTATALSYVDEAAVPAWAQPTWPR